MIYLDNDDVLVMHLGMSGSFHVEKKDNCSPLHENLYHDRDRLDAHDHVILHLERDAENFRITYNDPRRFGYMDLIAADRLNEHKYFADLGVEPTGNSLDGELLNQLFTGRKAPLKAALLDQKLIAGLGNIYVCEALWQARLSPRRQAKTICSLTRPATIRSRALSDAVRDVIARAIEAGGSSLSDHRRTDGTLGYFQHRFNVYDREDETCKRPDCNGVIKRIVQSGRSTYFCASCQK